MQTNILDTAPASFGGIDCRCTHAWGPVSGSLPARAARRPLLGWCAAFAGEDEEDLEHEASFAVVPVVNEHDDHLERHAEHHRREQCGGEADVAFLVVDGDAVEVGAHVGDANDGRHAELDLVEALRVEEEGAEAGEQGEEDGATCRRHLRQLEALPRHFFLENRGRLPNRGVRWLRWDGTR